MLELSVANMAEETPIKKPRGNPQFQLNKKKKQEGNTTNNTMAYEKNEKGEVVKDKVEEVKEKPTTTSGETPPPPAPDTLPSDLFSDKMPGEEILPLDGAVKSKSYAELPSDAVTSSETPPSKDGVTPPVTPAVIEPPKTPEEINSQAEATVKLMLKGYDKLHSLGRWLGKVDQGDLTQQHAKGKIDLERQLPLGKKTITVQDFFTEYNQGIDENIVVSQEFKDEITPPLKRIVIKKNWLLNDEMTVLVLLGEDLSTKVSMLIGLKKSANLVLNAVQEMTKATKEKNEGKKQPTTTQEEHPTPTEENVDWHEETTPAP